MIRDIYDSVVVGSGPAGSSAARTLAEGGASVLILEKNRGAAENIACAEGISRKSFERIPGHDPRCISAVVNRVQVVSPGGTRIDLQLEEIGYVLERKIFDRQLCVSALHAGAELLLQATFRGCRRDGNTWIVEFDRRGTPREVRCRLLLGADGPASSVAKRTGVLDPEKSIEAHYCDQHLLAHPEVPEDVLEFHFGTEVAANGYAWVFSKGPGMANVGIGVTESMAVAEEHLKRFLDRRFPGGRTIHESKGIVPVMRENHPMVGDRVMIAGDAARLADPASGGGIAAAYLSGGIAGEVGARCLSLGTLDRSALSDYPNRYWEIFGRDYEISSLLRDLWMRLGDDDVEYIVSEMKPIVESRGREELDSLSVLLELIKSSPGVLGLLMKKGVATLGTHLKNVVLPTA
jgi:digeranylgeranylglycerophospholipid reductase